MAAARMATTADLEALQADATTAAPDARHRWPFGAHGDDWLREVADASQAPDPRWCEWQARQGEWAAALPAGRPGLAEALTWGEFSRRGIEIWGNLHRR